MEFVCLFACLIDCLLGFVFAFPVPTHVGDQTPVKQTRRKKVRRGTGVITFIPARWELWDMDTRIICWHAYAQQHHDHDHHHYHHHNLDNHHHVIGLLNRMDSTFLFTLYFLEAFRAAND